MNATRGRGFARWPAYGARIIALSWAGLWVLFGGASGGEEAGIAVHTAMPGVLFLALALVGWAWPRAGGWLLTVTGAALAVGYPLAMWGAFASGPVILVTLAAAVPALASGMLFLLQSRRGVADSGGEPVRPSDAHPARPDL